ncbi:hypothetical protein Cantr_01700 [Candida viswanathii]|uniref:Uncharacterized protein n=1 Tax=Candida viswanathii TaxID=5486 RepID=A0A367YJS0_9ASCO|nr:hypothetical protein Cantr_01700 [Candida viswanathii]
MSDKYNFITPAKVRILLVPINNCTTSSFQRYVNLIKTNVVEVRLLDVTENNDLHYFNPATFPKGRIFPEFISSSIENELIFLHDFEPFRKTFIVLGIGPYKERVSAETALKELRKEYHTAIVHKLILFDSPEEKLQSQGEDSVFYHNSKLSHLTALETIFCDISGSFLTSLDEYATAYSNITLRSPVSITDGNVLAKTISQAQKRLSSGSTSFKASFSTATPAPPASPSASEKSKTHLKHLGRQRKLMGNFYLLTGKYNAAFQNFTECLTSLKKSDDYLWLASALEGVAVSMILMEFIGVPYQLPSQTMNSILQIPKHKASTDTAMTRKGSVESNGSTMSPRNSITSSNGFSLNALTSNPDLNNMSTPELLKIILARVIYFYGLTSTDFENMVPDIVYVESILREIKALTGLHFSHSIEDIVRSRTSDTPNINRSISKLEIISEIDKIFQLQLVNMSIVDQCRIYSALATMYTDLGFYRKKAFILRVLLVGLLPQLNTSDLPPQAIIDILESLFVVYGINAEPEASSKDAFSHAQSNWTSLQIQLLRLALKIGEALSDKSLLLKVSSLLLTRYTHCLPPDDQIKLKSKIEDILATNRGLSTPYWDPFLVRKVKFIVSKSRGELVPLEEHSKNGNGSDALAPFFDPYAKKTIDPTKIPTLIAEDIYQLKVTLQNPFAFDVEIHDILIVSEGVQIETIKSLIQVAESTTFASTPSFQNPSGIFNNKIRQSSNTKRSSPTSTTMSQVTSAHSVHTLTIPPNSSEKFLISFKALSSGNTRITGFDISVGNCQSHFFRIIEKEKFDYTIKLSPEKKVQESTTNTLDRLVHNLHDGDAASDTARVSSCLLPLLIIPPQPSLTLLDILASNGCLMLLEGERHEVSVTLTNNSLEAINYLSFSFWDSTVEFINKKLANANLSAVEIYELEWHLLKFKPFKILNKDIIGENIEPGKNIELKCELTSRKFMNELKIVLDYAHKCSKEVAVFMKHLDIPLNVSVMPSVDVVGCDIFPVMTLLDKVPPGLHKVMEYSQKGDDYCLLVLDLRNSWSEKLLCHLQYEDFEVSEAIQAGKTLRIVIPVKRISPDVSQPIPSLRNKQFVKNYSITEEEEKHIKKLFWLRYSILEKLLGSWSLGQRQGIIDLRAIRLTSKMANMFVYEKVHVSNTIVKDSGKPVERVGNTYNLSLDEFYILRTSIVNDSEETISGIIRHLPLPLHAAPPGTALRPLVTIDKKMLINGTLQNKFQEIKPGNRLDLEVSFVIIERGEFEWGTVVDLLTEQIITRQQVYITAY